MLKLPFKGNYPITQGFGLNYNMYYKNEGLKGHQGIDYGTPMGTPIIAPCDGVVVAISLDIKRGEGVSIMSDNVFKWNGQDCKLICVHWHLKDKSIVVKIGDKVKTGQLLGLSNNTGQTTGPHLHFSTLPVATDGSRRSLAGLDNGYKGCVDPKQFLEPEQVNVKIQELQALLNKYGANLKTDGIFGALSKKALEEFLK